jgi:ribosomal protein S12 methylthiotransferase
MYFYPMYVTDELIDTIAGSRRIVPYLDMPLQHASDRMLRRMQRRVDHAATESLLEKLRSRIPGLALRTTFITGFPGETEADFDELVEFVRRQRFERMGVFTYSFEPDTPAAKLPDHLPEEIKNERRDRLMAEQQQIAFAWNDAQVGSQMDVILDTAVAGEENAFVGRSTSNAPDVDGVVYVSGENLRVGAIVPCEIVGRSEYDLVAAAVGPSR